MGVIFINPYRFGFNPLSLSPALWLDASDTSTITASSGAVSQWNDKSGNGRNVSQSTASAQPSTGVNTRNGKNVLTFALSSRLFSASFTLAQPITAFITFVTGSTFANQNTAPGTRYCALLDGNASGSGVRLIQFQRVVDLSSRPSLYAGTTVAAGSSALANSTGYIQGGYFNGSSSKMRLNGSDIQTSMNIGTGGITGGITIALNDANGRFLGDLCELIVFGSVLSADNTTSVESYLNAKWAIY